MSRERRYPGVSRLKREIVEKVNFVFAMARGWETLSGSAPGRSSEYVNGETAGGAARAKRVWALC